MEMHSPTQEKFYFIFTLISVLQNVVISTSMSHGFKLSSMMTSNLELEKQYKPGHASINMIMD